MSKWKYLGSEAIQPLAYNIIPWCHTTDGMASWQGISISDLKVLIFSNVVESELGIPEFDL